MLDADEMGLLYDMWICSCILSLADRLGMEYGQRQGTRCGLVAQAYSGWSSITMDTKGFGSMHSRRLFYGIRRTWYLRETAKEFVEPDRAMNLEVQEHQ